MKLIEPTRTLKHPEKTFGKISIFSEPPSLDVFLDSAKIGKTPIVYMKVEASIHSLRIKDSETKVQVVPDKSLRISLYKGSFIEIQEKEREKLHEPEETITKEKVSKEITEKEDKEKEPKHEPLHRPMNPKGPILE